jgi:tRNA(Glu) U13 pseudouridine synthase TruD
VQWFSIPSSAVDHPGPLRRAGVQGKMRVLAINAAHKPVGPETVERLKWTLHLRGGSAGDGYLRARAIVDRLRHGGFPNYLLPRQVGEDGGLARWGRQMVEGRRLPAQVAAKTDPARYLRALQEELFNDWLGRRVADGLLAACVPGDVVRGNTGALGVVDDPAATAKRLASWEAMVLGPLFGNGMAPAAGEALAREQLVLAEAGLAAGQVARLRGDRRAVRAQPAKSVVDRAKADLVITCELPSDTYVEALLAELLRGAGASADDAGDEAAEEPA